MGGAVGVGRGGVVGGEAWAAGRGEEWWEKGGLWGAVLLGR